MKEGIGGWKEDSPVKSGTTTTMDLIMMKTDYPMVRSILAFKYALFCCLHMLILVSFECKRSRSMLYIAVYIYMVLWLIAGWLDCPAYGQEIFGCIIPSKVPLDESYNQYITPGKTYTPKQVIHQQRILGREVSSWVQMKCLIFVF